MQKIEFNQERDFSKVFSDTLGFIKQNFKSFFGAIILIAGPFLLISGASIGYMQSSMMSLSRGLIGPGFSEDMLGMFSLVMFLAIIGNTVLYSVVYNYMLLYYSKPFGEKITVTEVGQKVLSNFGRVMGAMFILLVIMIIIIIVAAFVIVGIATLMGVIGGILIALGVLVLALIYGPILAYYFSASFFVVVRDQESIFNGWGKVHRYLKGNFWWTWLIMFITVIVLYIINAVFSLPATILVMAKTFARLRDSGAGNDNSILLIVLYTAGLFLSYCTSSVMLVLGAFNFLSHEEKHEGKGLLSRIEEIK
jgi:hypothetical protein